MKAISLYSGGCDGLSLAASWVGIETLAFCDADITCRDKLAQRHPNKPIFGLDTEVTTDAIINAGINPGDIDLILASPPCQCASVAGKGLGAADPRNRWPEFLRIVGDLRPRWVMAENVPGLLTAPGEPHEPGGKGVKGEFFGSILYRLATMGYRVGWGVYAASDIGAPHRRKRLAIVACLQCGDVAHSDGQRQQQSGGDQRQSGGWAGNGGQGMADPKSKQAGRLCEPPIQSNAGRDGIGSLANADSTIWKRPVRYGNSTRSGGLADSSLLGYADNTRLEVPGHKPRIETVPEANGTKYASRRSTQPGLGLLFDGVSDRLANQSWPHPRVINGPAPQFDFEPPRVAKGIKNRVADIKMLGNAVVPQWAVVTLAGIARWSLENGTVRPLSKLG